jgi:hypothetical protein
MKQQHLIFGIIAIVSIILFFAWTKLKNHKPKPDTDTRRPPENNLPTNKVTNDKLVIIEDISENDAKKILQEFCNSYNKEIYQALPSLTKLSDRKFAVTFPYDLSFTIYCFL